MNDPIESGFKMIVSTMYTKIVGDGYISYDDRKKVVAEVMESEQLEDLIELAKKKLDDKWLPF